MIKLYICPECGWMRTVSRRANVECFKCSNVEMVPVKLEYTKYVQMSGEERENYVESWMYIHSKKTVSYTHLTLPTIYSV